MKIFINDKSFTVVLYDDGKSILQRYALSVNALPEYFRIINKDFQLQENLRLQIKDIRIKLKKITLPDLAKNIETLKSSYPGMKNEDIALLWLILYIEEDSSQLNLLIDPLLPTLRKIDSIIFPTVGAITNLYREYPDKIQVRLKELTKKLNEYENITNRLDKVTPIEAGKFNLEEITSLYVLDIPNGISLEDIFDAMDVTEDIPFILLFYKGKNWYKVYQHVTPPTEWTNYAPLIDGLYFKILSFPYGKLSSSDYSDFFYSNGIWFENNHIEITFDVKTGVGEAIIREKFLSSLSNRITYKILQEKQLGIRGKFSIESKMVPLNKAIFADMISNNPIFKYFLFLNERNKTVINKPRFFLYYEPDQTGIIAKAITIIVTTHVDEEIGQWIDVRISRAQNYQQANAFRMIFSKLLGLYNSEYQNIINIYKNLLPNATKLLAKYVKILKAKKRPDLKSGKRLRELKAKRSGIFQANYSSTCQPRSHQPYLINKQTATKIEEKYGDHKVMEFIDPITKKPDYYACEPREVYDEDKRYIWPGLQKNIKMKNKDTVPFVPCCFTDDQYIKESSLLFKQLKEGGSEKEIAVGTTGYILAPSKSVPIGRFGELPFNLSFIVKNAGYDEIEIGKQNVLPIFRFGVISAPDSFLHCLEKVFNPRYSSLNYEKKRQQVISIRKKLSKTNFAVAKQELYDYTDKNIQNILLNDDTYIDPGLFIRLVEVYYGCNIFIYQIDSNNLGGVVVMPRFSQAYLCQKIDQTRPTVFIVKNAISGDYPFQCELIVKYNPDKKIAERFLYMFKNDAFVDEAIRIFQETDRVSIITPETSFYFKNCDFEK
uniref:Uncharacterized protein n=1 Tax=Marseillevirus LCMAC102 TaxID=2506603 RepID=A0A481YVY5_9VIRU|nr:MAG: hypothetical protein LCMAC102_04630 [Marseillevirus LCMAC102]